MPASEPVSAAYRENYGEKWLFQPAAHSLAGPGGPSQPRAQGESSTGSVSRGRGLHAGRPQRAACHLTQRPPDSSARPPGVAFEPAASLPRLRVTPACPSQPRGACGRHVAGNVPGSSGRAASWSASPLGVEGLPGVASGQCAEQRQDGPAESSSWSIGRSEAALAPDLREQRRLPVTRPVLPGRQRSSATRPGPFPRGR